MTWLYVSGCIYRTEHAKGATLAFASSGSNALFRVTGLLKLRSLCGKAHWSGSY